MKSSKTILAIDTTIGNSAALLKDGAIFHSEASIAETNKKSAALLKIDSLLKNKSIKINDIDAIGINTGPGSFTGIRIGIALVKGLARPFDIPVVPIKTFEAIAHMMEMKNRYSIIINAGGGFVYLQTCIAESKDGKDDSARLVHSDNLASETAGSEEIVLYGPGLDHLSEKIKGIFPSVKIVISSSPLLDSIVSITEAAFEKNNTTRYRELKPCYIKPSYADMI